MRDAQQYDCMVVAQQLVTSCYRKELAETNIISAKQALTCGFSVIVFASASVPVSGLSLMIIEILAQYIITSNRYRIDGSAKPSQKYWPSHILDALVKLRCL